MSEDKLENKTYVALWQNCNIPEVQSPDKRDEGRGFLNQAMREVEGRREIYYSSAHEYKTGEEVINALILADNLSCGKDIKGDVIRRPIHLVNIFGHGVPIGLTSPYKGVRGIYSISKGIDLDGNKWEVDQNHGGRIITDLPPGIFAKDAVIVIHNCSTSRDFAVAFLQRLVRGGKEDAKVIAHRDLTGASFNIQWSEHTKAHPGGVRRAPLGRKYWLHPG